MRWHVYVRQEDDEKMNSYAYIGDLASVLRNISTDDYITLTAFDSSKAFFKIRKKCIEFGLRIIVSDLKECVKLGIEVLVVNDRELLVNSLLDAIKTWGDDNPAFPNV